MSIDIEVLKSDLQSLENDLAQAKANTLRLEGAVLYLRERIAAEEGASASGNEAAEVEPAVTIAE